VSIPLLSDDRLGWNIDALSITSMGDIFSKESMALCLNHADKVALETRYGIICSGGYINIIIVPSVHNMPG
jgi:hypothetical protein